mgnify:FL=1
MTVYELTIESAEINLLVTEGLVDKGKKVLEDTIKKVKEFVRKLIELVKKVFNDKVKTIKDMASKIKKRVSQRITEPIMLASVDKLNGLLHTSEYTLQAIEKSDFSSDDAVNMSLERVAEALAALRGRFDKTKDNILVPTKGDSVRIALQYDKCADYCDKIGAIGTRLGKRTSDMLDELKSPGKEIYPNTLNLSSKISAALSQISTIIKFAYDAMIHSIRKLNSMNHGEE